VVVPRDPPPLYSWEVVPELYPPLPLPRRPRVPLPRLARATLVGVVVLAVVSAAILATYGTEATGPASYTVSGTVYLEWKTNGYGPGGVRPTVLLTVDNGRTFVNQTNTDGQFSFSNVPVGGITLNVTAPGFASTTVYTFASPVYNAGTTDLSITLDQNPANATTVTLSQFPNLETFLASIGSAIVLLGIVALIAGIAVARPKPTDRPAIGVAAGVAAMLIPVVLYFLALDGLFDLLTVVTAILGGFGAFAATVGAIEVYQRGPEGQPA